MQTSKSASPPYHQAHGRVIRSTITMLRACTTATATASMTMPSHAPHSRLCSPCAAHRFYIMGKKLECLITDLPISVSFAIRQLSGFTKARLQMEWCQRKFSRLLQITAAIVAAHPCNGVKLLMQVLAP